ncbi:DUF6932 family protein [Spirosoma areae]
MTFDERGLLTPANMVSLTAVGFEELFVNAFPDSATRRPIFASYRQFTEQFSDQVCSTFTHWIDGSFVTNKLNPNDIDIVVLVDDSLYDTRQSVIDDSFRLAGAKRLFPGLDVYTVRCYRAESRKYYITEYDLAYWYNWFTQTKPNRFGKRFRKGFVQLIYNPE